MPEKIREIPASEAAIVDQLVSDAFGYVKPQRFLRDFPVWGSEMSHRYGIFEGNTLISHVGLRVTELADLRVGLVGAVATSALHRGKGHSTRLLEHVIDIGRAKKLDWLILWGSEHDFYGRFGFQLSGIQSRVRLADIPLPMPMGPKLTIHSGYTREIFTAMLYDTHPQSLRLKAADRDWFEKHESVKWFWTGDPFAFVGFERGMDLPHLVHEWGGHRDGVLQLLAHVHRLDPAAELLTHPSFFAKLGLGPETPQTTEKLCLAKPLSEKASGAWPDAFWISGLNAC